MAGNGGVIGPTQSVNAAVSEVVTTVTSSTPSAVTLQSTTSSIDFLAVVDPVLDAEIELAT